MMPSLSRLAGSALALAALAAPRADAAEARPDVLLIIVDDLNTRLSAYGNDAVATPSLERLAQRGRRFDRAYNQFPICNPSRASLMSGWRPSRTGVWSNKMPAAGKLAGATLLQDHFRANGYFTARLGKIYHHEEGFEWDLAEYFEWAAGKKPTESLEPPEWSADGFFAAKWAATDNRDDEEPDGRSARRAVELIGQARDQPLFMAVGFVRPHGPWVAPKRYFEMYPEQEMQLPPTVEGDLEDVPRIAMNRGSDPVIPDGKRRMAIAAYSACVSFMDAQLGLILDALDRGDRWGNTVVVLVGDNGIHRGEHGIWKKNSLFEVSSRVPLFIAAPGVAEPGTATDSLVELVDIYPTLVDLAGIPTVDGLDGTSLVPVLLDPARSVKTAAFTYSERGGDSLATSVRTERYRYTLWPSGEAELYDHDVDPREHVNLAGRPDHSTLVEEMQALIRSDTEKS